DLETRAGGVEVADVHRVPVTQPGRVQAGAVVVDGRGPVDDLVLLVAVDVRDGEVVVPLTGVSLVAGVIRGEEPPLGEPFAVEVDGPHGGAGVVAAREPGAGALAVA